MEEGVGGRGFMKVRGVAGGSMFGTIFFQALMKPESSAGAAGRSEEKGRTLAAKEEEEEMAGRARRRAAWRSMLGRVKSLGSQGRRVRYRKNERKREPSKWNHLVKNNEACA